MLRNPISVIDAGKIYSTDDGISRTFTRKIEPKMINNVAEKVIIRFTGAE